MTTTTRVPHRYRYRQACAMTGLTYSSVTHKISDGKWKGGAGWVRAESLADYLMVTVDELPELLDEAS